MVITVDFWRILELQDVFISFLTATFCNSFLTVC